MRDLVFKDLHKNNEYYGYIKTAVEYGIVEGYSKDSFKPNKILTREEAIATLSRALKITGVDKEDYESVESTLSNYDDYKDVSTWALKSFISSTYTGLVEGRGNAKLAPKALVTRAEVAQLLENALRISKLID